MSASAIPSPEEATESFFRRSREEWERNGGHPAFKNLSKGNAAIARLDAAPSQGSRSSQPVQLVRQTPPPAAFPVDALGPVLAPAAQAIAELVQVPDSLGGNAVLAAAALAAQAHANVQTLGGVRPLSLNLLTIAESGERKTTADVVAGAPIRERVAALQVGYREELREWEANAEAYKMRVRNAKEKASKANDPNGLVGELRDLREPEPPRKPFMMASEPTAEGLLLSLKDGQLSQGLFSDEGGSLIGGHALSDEAELRTIAMLSKAWDGAPLDRVRAKEREHTTLFGRRLSLHLMAQPEVANRLLGKSLYRSQGFLARFLIAAPASLIGTRQHSGHTIEASNDPRVRRYWAALAELLSRPASEDAEVGGLSPPCLALSPEARTLLVSVYNEIEAAQAADGQLSTVREFASKAGEHACRIAGVLTLVSNPQAVNVSVEDMTRALTLVQFYLGEHVRLAGSASVSVEISNAQKLLDWFRRKALVKASARDVMRAGPNSIRDATTAKAALRLLAEHGWLDTEDGSRYVMPMEAQAALAEATCSN